MINMVEIEHLDIKKDDGGKEICPFCNKPFASVRNHLEKNATCNKKYQEGTQKMGTVEEAEPVEDELEEALKAALTGNNDETVKGAEKEQEETNDEKDVAELFEEKKRIKWVKDLPFDEILGKAKGAKIKAWMADHDYILTKQLAAAKIDEITKIDGIAEKSARAIITFAMAHAGRKYFTRAIDIIADYEVLTSGCPDFDAILGGGFRTDGSYVAFGPYNSGKTALAQQIAANTQLEPEYGGFYNPDDPPICLWFDTESTSDQIMKPQGADKKTRTRRFGEIALWTFKRNVPKKAGESDDDYDARAIAFQRRVLTNTLVTDLASAEDQVAIVDDLKKTIHTYGNVRLIILDSLIARFRSEYIGLNELSKRQQALNKHIHELQNLCGKEAILFVTNQIQDTAGNAYGIGFKEAGGNIVKHDLDVHLQMRRGQKGSIHVQIIDAAGLPPGDCNLRLTEKGLEPMD